MMSRHALEVQCRTDGRGHRIEDRQFCRALAQRAVQLRVVDGDGDLRRNGRQQFQVALIVGAGVWLCTAMTPNTRSSVEMGTPNQAEAGLSSGSHPVVVSRAGEVFADEQRLARADHVPGGLLLAGRGLSDAASRSRCKAGKKPGRVPSRTAQCKSCARRATGRSVDGSPASSSGKSRLARIAPLMALRIVNCRIRRSISARALACPVDDGQHRGQR